MATGKALDGKPHAGNPHVWFDEREVASAAASRRGSLLYKQIARLAVAIAAGVAVSASARTVYDAGKALRQNCRSGSYSSPYTDENGGSWSYARATGSPTFSNLGGWNNHAKTADGKFDGFGGSAEPFIKVNVTGETVTESPYIVDGDPIEADELLFFPGSDGYAYTIVRFTVQEAGWYSVYASFRDTSKGTEGDTAGATVHIMIDPPGVARPQAGTTVSLENKGTRRFDFQAPVRWVEQGMRISFSVGGNGDNANDATAARIFIVKEDEGAFYDSGLAMTNNLATLYTNHYGNVRDGTWSYLLTEVPASSVNFAEWAPTNLTMKSSCLASRCTRASSGNRRGFAMNAEGTSPYMLVNGSNSGNATSILAPYCIETHPNGNNARQWTTLRFRPPVGGMYSGSVVVGHTGNNDSDGVTAYLCVSDHVVTNATVAISSFQRTAHLTFAPRLLSAEEPIDVIISPGSSGSVSADQTAFSAIFRREQDVYDAGSSFFAHHAAGNHNHPFPDALGGGATWDLGAKTNGWCGTQFYSLPAYKTLDGSNLTWWVHSASGTQENGNLPRITMATNGITSVDSYYVSKSAPLLGTLPYEFFAHPNSVNLQSTCPTLKATVPTDGIYRARGYARDVAPNNDEGVDGIRLCVAVGTGYMPAFTDISRDKIRRNGNTYESAAEGGSLWLRAGDRIEFVVDPIDIYSSDGTGLSACYVRENGTLPQVMHVDVNAAGSGTFSSHSGRGREGWAEWNRWNALRVGSVATSAAARGCYAADGQTRYDATVTLTRDSGADITTDGVSGASAMLNCYVSSADASDTYTFSIRKLKKNEPYTLWLYSAKGNATGNATFTVGGVTKGVEETWAIGLTRMLTRFDVTSDANGTITGTFAAADSNGGAFNGLTLVGDLPAYAPNGTMVIFR